MNANELFSLRGRIALVTGSTRGIGKAIATGFVTAGARVYVHGRDEARGRRLADEIGAQFIRADLEHFNEVERLAAELSAREDRLDVLVKNAGFDIEAKLDNIGPELLARVMRVNFEAPVQLTRLVLPLLRRSASASVINITSIHDQVPYYGNAAYCSSKAALAMFTKTIALELGPEGIRVNTIAPGAVETEINRSILDEIGRENFAQWIPLGRVAEPGEIVGPALFLASNAASYVSGATLVVDGAYSHHLVRYRLAAVAGGQP